MELDPSARAEPNWAETTVCGVAWYSRLTWGCAVNTLSIALR